MTCKAGISTTHLSVLTEALFTSWSSFLGEFPSPLMINGTLFPGYLVPFQFSLVHL